MNNIRNIALTALLIIAFAAAGCKSDFVPKLSCDDVVTEAHDEGFETGLQVGRLQAFAEGKEEGREEITDCVERCTRFEDGYSDLKDCVERCD